MPNKDYESWELIADIDLCAEDVDAELKSCLAKHNCPIGWVHLSFYESHLGEPGLKVYKMPEFRDPEA